MTEKQKQINRIEEKVDCLIVKVDSLRLWRATINGGMIVIAALLGFFGIKLWPLLV